MNKARGVQFMNVTSSMHKNGIIHGGSSQKMFMVIDHWNLLAVAYLLQFFKKQQIKETL